MMEGKKMHTEFKTGDKVRVKRTMHNPYGGRKLFEWGDIHTVSYNIVAGVLLHGTGLDGTKWDFTSFLELVPQKTATQIKAEELREQAQDLLNKAIELEATV